MKNAGRIITKNESVPQSFLYQPLAYQGRTASIVPSGSSIQRPWGYFAASGTSDQTRTTERQIVYGPSAKIDYEVELAAIIGKPLPMCQRLTPAQAEDHIFGFVLLNDWSGKLF